MLRIIASNRQEALLDQLAERLRTPATSPTRAGGCGGSFRGRRSIGWTTEGALRRAANEGCPGV
jgi:hypothetical protein